MISAGLGLAAWAANRLGLPCLIQFAFSEPCPGCGGTRALVALYGGHLGEAVAANVYISVFALCANLAAVCMTIRLSVAKLGVGGLWQ